MEKAGGSYIKRKKDNVQCIAATADHPDGNCARDKKGNPLDIYGQPQTTKPADESGSQS